jgi:hypothetical protein
MIGVTRFAVVIVERLHRDLGHPTQEYIADHLSQQR